MSAPGRRAQTPALLRQAVSLQGRLRRRGWWLSWVGFGVAFLSVQYLALAFVSSAHPFAGRTQGAALIAPTGLAIMLLLAWPATAAMVRRGHDRGYPASRTAAVWTVFLALGLLAPVLPFDARLSVQAALLVYFIADYGCTPGVRGANRYGDDPRLARPGARA